MALGLRDLFLLREDVVFLNHGSFGACPRQVFSVYQEWQLELERQPVEFLDQHRRSLKLMRTVREELGRYLGSPPENLVTVTNATTGLNVVARSLPLQPGDEILTTNQEYGALEKTWTFITQKTGARYVHAEVPLPLNSAEVFTEAIWSQVTSRTKVLFLSHLTSATALLFPIEELVRRAREAGIWTVIDGAHAPGQVPLDLSALDADFYSGNCHKWMLTPKGSALLYAHPRVQPLIEPLVVSHGWDPDSDDGAFGNSAFIDSLEFQGTRDLAAVLAIPEAIRFLQERDWPTVQQACHQLAWETAETLCAETGLEPLVAPELRSGLQMVSLPLPDCDVNTLKHRLYEEFRIEIPVFRWQDRCFARISVQGYNTPEEAQLLLEALRKLLPEVASS
jgi:isopenicillin-N epimerase